MSPTQFEQEVFENKRELMILDNLVLDVKGYETHHPGGRFVMQRNLGRDISKYFYGGYTMMAGRQP
jgi:cytochrome b involved in lipid metabolism